MEKAETRETGTGRRPLAAKRRPESRESAGFIVSVGGGVGERLSKEKNPPIKENNYD